MIQASAGDFKAFDAVCPHAGCTVAYSAPNKIISCPCHGSLFDATTGAVERGPAPHGLRAIDVADSGGSLYAT